MSERERHIEAQPGRSAASIWAVALGLFLFALVPRVVNLGNLSFYADEDISVLTASSVANGDGPYLPSGMEYRRALPFTWLNALSARISGAVTERSIRLPSAILGALTIPALFLFGRRWLGTGVGMTAALMLSVSEWHLVFSRQSRMYVPLVLFIVLGTWGLWTWVRTGSRRSLAGGLAAALVAIFLHRLGLLLAAAPLVWLAFPGAVAVSIPAIFAVAGLIAISGWAIDGFWVDAPYGDLPIPPRMARLAPVEVPPEVTGFGWVAIALGILGVLLAFQVVRKLGHSRDSEPGSALRRGAVILSALAAGAAAGTGQVYALAVAGAIFLLLARTGIRPLVAHSPLPLVALAGLLALYIGVWTLQVGLVEAIKISAAFPYPHSFTLLLQDPAPVILFGLAALSLIVFPYDEDRWGMAAATMLVFGTLTALGLVREAGPTRYLITAYPLMILVASAGLYLGARWLVTRVAGTGRIPAAWVGPAAGALAAGVVLSGALPGHGVDEAVRIVRLEHGDPVDPLTHMFPFRPDHRSVGRYVREHRRPGDIVVAEDPLVQGWYAGDIDFWFRRYGDMRRYLRIHPDGVQRDIYVGSAELADPVRLDSLVAAHAHAVWLITSAETVGVPRFYYSPEQRDWLDSLRRAREPDAVGEDGVSQVFCLNCDGAPASSAR